MSVQERIYEWSRELPPWQGDLLRRLAAGALSEEDEKEILRMLVGSKNAPAPRPLERTDLPDDEPDADPVELREIRDVQNINLLADGQALRFKPGINLVFGGTGAGKSGYGRLLRRLSRPADEIEVLHNAFDANGGGKRQTATLQIAVGDDLREIAVDLAEEPDRVLSAIALFDSVRAPSWVSKPSLVGHVPEPLFLLRRLAEAQEALRLRLKERMAEIRDELPTTRVKPSTPAAHLVTSITAQTDMAELERLATLSDAERDEAKEIDAALGALRFEDSRDRENAARARARSAERVAAQLERASEKLADDRIDAIGDLRVRFDEAAEAERSLAADAFSKQAFQGTGQGPWRAMWQAARRFVESEGGGFPSEDRDGACPLCQQELSVDAREQLAKLEEFVSTDLRKKIAALANELSSAVDDLPDISALEALVEASLSGAPHAALEAASSTMDALSARVELARKRAKGSSIDLDSAPKLPPAMPIRAYADEQLAAADTQAALRDEDAQQKLIDRRTALRGREELASLLPEISQRISGLRKLERLSKASEELRTSKVSSQLRKLQEGAITKRLCHAIVEELTAMNLLAEDIDVEGKAKNGRTAIEFGLRGSADVKVGAVLSEGEQRALALALFLAENSVGGRRSALVLDDPVALMDRERSRYVAGRLVEEAGRRQVIVFTHDFSFLQMLQRAAADADRKMHSQALQRAYGRAGILGEIPASGEALAAS